MAGRSILPAAAMFEAAAAAFSTANTAAAAGAATLLAAFAIAAPLALTAQGDALLDITFNPATGTLAAHSLNLLTAERQLHLRAAAARFRSTAALSEAPAGSAAVTAAAPAPWQAAVLREAAAEMRRYEGGTLAALDVAWEQGGSGYITHPAVADSCLHTGAVFTAPPSLVEDGEVRTHV